MRAPFTVLLVATFAAAFASACAKVQGGGPLDPTGTGGSSGPRDGTGGSRAPRNDAGGVFVDTGAGESCGSFMFQPTAKTAVLMLVLDRSGSMKNSLPNGAGTKWTVVTAAIDPTVSGTQKSIEWGMKTFPGDDGCGIAAGIDVQTAAMNTASGVTAERTGSPPLPSSPRPAKWGKSPSPLGG